MDDSGHNGSSAVDGATKPKSAGESSQTQMIWRRFWAISGARWGLIVLALIVVVACWAPLLVGNVALLWWDDQGLRLPVIEGLLNKRITPTPYDLGFGVMGLLAPLLGAVIAFGRCWFPALAPCLRWRYALLTWAVVMVALVVPLPQGDGWRALWRERPPVEEVIEAYRSHQLGVGVDEAGGAGGASAAGQSSDIDIFAIFPPVAYSPYLTSTPLLPPMALPDSGGRHWLGTDDRGFDCLARVVYGARITLTVGMVATALSLLIGVIVGAVSGFFLGWVDLFLQRAVEIMMTFPTFVFLLVIVSMLGRDILLIMTVIGLTGWAGVARLVRGEFLVQSGREYVLAGRVLGYSNTRLMFRHILPNSATPLLINAAFAIAGAILVESTLAFLGLGDPLAPSWGAQLDVGRRNLHYIWLIWVPGTMIFVVVMALNLIGDALREAVDAKGGAE